MSGRTFYDDEKIEALVKAANTAADVLSGSSLQIYSVANPLYQALKPFLPDPDEALIEAMVEAYSTVVLAVSSAANEGMRAALAAYREYMDKEQG